MATLANEISSVKFKLKFADGKGTYTFSKLKLDATDQQIYETAAAMATLQKYPSDELYKIIERDLSEE